MVKLESLKTALLRAEWGFQKETFKWAIANYSAISSPDYVVFLDYCTYADRDNSAMLNDVGDNCSNGFYLRGRPSCEGRFHIPHVIQLLPQIKLKKTGMYPVPIAYRGSYASGKQIIDLLEYGKDNILPETYNKSSWCNSQEISYQPSYCFYRQPVKVVYNKYFNGSRESIQQQDINSVVEEHNNTKAQLDNAYKTSLTCLNRQEQDAYFTMQYRSTITPHIFRQALDLVGSGRIKSDMWGVIPSCSWLNDSYFVGLGFTLPSYKYYNSLFCTVNKFLGVKPNHGWKKHIKLMPSVNADGSKEWSF